MSRRVHRPRTSRSRNRPARTSRSCRPPTTSVPPPPAPTRGRVRPRRPRRGRPLIRNSPMPAPPSRLVVGTGVLVLAASLAGPGRGPGAVTRRPAQPDPPGPVTLTAEQDRQLMLDQLKIPAGVMRRGPSGLNPKAADYQNTDEAKANPWPHLPEMMVTKGRKTVDTPELWWKERWPEIVEYFDAVVYGRVPKDLPKVTWEIDKDGKGFVPKGGGAVKSVTKQLVGRVDNSACPAITVNIRLMLILPADAPGPVPVMMDFGGGACSSTWPKSGATPSSAPPASRRTALRSSVARCAAEAPSLPG